MELTPELVLYLLSVAASAGAVMARIRVLERKVEKHNNLVERMAVVEARTRANTDRLDRLARTPRAQLPFAGEEACER